jgi:Zn-dependent M28 family amino/carboxypeptidase
MRRVLPVMLAAGVVVLQGCLHSPPMPGQSFTGPLPPLTPEANTLADALRRHVQVLSVDIGRRHVGAYPNLQRAAGYIESTLTAMGFSVVSQRWDVGGKEVRNLEVTIPGTRLPDEIVLIGAHYDSARHSPAADDNGSGVAALLELARLLRTHPAPRTIRCVFFVNEEPPFFGGPGMGSWQYARAARKRNDRILAMLALDSIGRFTDQPNSQHYPAAIAKDYPSTGNFIAFVSRTQDLRLLQSAVVAFRDSAAFPSEGAALPAFLPGVWYSDHWSFWQFHYPALLVTDTAFYRYKEYHTPNDTIDAVDFPRLARVTLGLRTVLARLATDAIVTGAARSTTADHRQGR